MMALLIAGLICGAPNTEVLSAKEQLIAKRLSTFIVSLHYRKSRKAKVARYAPLLARRIVIEARRYKLSVVTFATIAWIESWFWRWCKGTSREFGIWQIWPRSSAVAKGWNLLRKNNRIGTHPNISWRKLGHKGREAVMADLVVSTALAAYLLKGVLNWCRRRHRINPKHILGSIHHRYEIDRAGHYNSGYAWPKPGYFWQLRRRSARLRRVLYR